MSIEEQKAKLKKRLMSMDSEIAFYEGVLSRLKTIEDVELMMRLVDMDVYSVSDIIILSLYIKKGNKKALDKAIEVGAQEQQRLH